MAFCSNCGSEINQEMKYCKNCGTPVYNVNQAGEVVQAGKQTEGNYSSPGPQQSSYAPGEPQQYMPTEQQQGAYAPPEPQQGVYIPQGQPAAGPAGAEKKPIDKRFFIFGGSALAIILVGVLLITLVGGKGKKGPAGDLAGGNGGQAGKDVQEIWNGNWYGYCWTVNAFGEWDHFDDYLFDAYMVIDVDKKGRGTLKIYFGNDFDSWDDWVNWDIHAEIKAEIHNFVVIKGYLWDLDLDPKNWWVGLDPVNVGNHVIITDTYLDPELTTEDGFEYIFRFRPYGERWDKEIAEDAMLPPGYYDYIEELGAYPDDSSEREHAGFTVAELKAICDSLLVSADLGYEESVRSIF